MIKFSIHELKRQARCLLNGQHGFFALITFIMIAAQFVLTSVIDYAFPFSSTDTRSLLYFCVSLLSDILYVIFLTGSYKIYLNHMRNIKSQQYDLFFGFLNQPEHIALYAAIRFLLSYAFSETLSWCLGILFSKHSAFPASAALMILLLITGIIIYLYLTFSMVPFLYCDTPEKPASQLLRESNQLMQKNRGRLLHLKLSFLGIFLLSILSFGIGLLFVEPYLHLTQTLFYESLVTDQDDCA